jgi:O-antigen/teichoic acid export membrane protein
LGVSNPILSSMGGLIVPAVAIAQTQGGISAARRSATQYAAQGAALLLPYFAALALVPHLMLRLFYSADSPYLNYTTPLRLMVAVYAIFYLSQMTAGFLNGLGHSRWTFFAQAGAAIANALICLPLAAVVGLYGAAWGGIVPMVVQLAISIYFARSLLTAPASTEFDIGLLNVAKGAV